MGKLLPQTVREFKLTAKILKAAYLYANNESQREIAKQVPCSVSSLHKWLEEPLFQREVSKQLRKLQTELSRVSIANRLQRIKKLDRLASKLEGVMEARAEQHKDVPGGDTGILAHDVKSIGGGEFAERVDLYNVDTGLTKEYRETMKQAAIEAGQWNEQTEPLAAYEQTGSEYTLTVEDRRTFILQIFAELGHPISQEAIAALPIKDITNDAIQS